jgi:hypothetical protein
VAHEEAEGGEGAAHYYEVGFDVAVKGDVSASSWTLLVNGDADLGILTPTGMRERLPTVDLDLQGLGLEAPI